MMALEGGISVITKQMEGCRMIWNGMSNHGKEKKSVECCKQNK